MNYFGIGSEGKALVILIGKVRGYNRERHVLVDAERCLTEAARLVRTRRNVRDVVLLVPQPGGPLRWTRSDDRFPVRFGTVSP